jgi:hypothetical protein
VTVSKGASNRWYVAKLSGVSLTAGTQYFLALQPSGAYNGTYLGSDSEDDGPFSVFVDYLQ